MVTCRVMRKELTRVKQSLDAQESVLLHFVKRQLSIYSAGISEFGALVTFAYTPEDVDLSKGLPKDKFTIDREAFGRLFSVILSGKTARLSLSEKGEPIVEPSRRSGQPQLVVDIDVDASPITG